MATEEKVLEELATEIMSVARGLQKLNSDEFMKLDALLTERTPEGHHAVYLHFDVLEIRVVAARISRKARGVI